MIPSNCPLKLAATCFECPADDCIAPSESIRDGDKSGDREEKRLAALSMLRAGVPQLKVLRSLRIGKGIMQDALAELRRAG